MKNVYDYNKMTVLCDYKHNSYMIVKKYHIWVIIYDSIYVKYTLTVINPENDSKFLFIVYNRIVFPTQHNKGRIYHVIN